MSKISDAFIADSVWIRWVRTALATFTAAGAAIAVSYQGAVWVSDAAQRWAVELVQDTTSDLAVQVNQTQRSVDALQDLVRDVSGSVNTLSSTVEAVSEAQAQTASPPWRWSRADTSISDGLIGGSVEVQASGFKLRECAAPVIDMYFINGESRVHRFADISIINSLGRGIALPVSLTRQQTVRYTAVIPADENIQPGRAQAFITVSYPDLCPQAAAETIGPLQFRILDD